VTTCIQMFNPIMMLIGMYYFSWPMLAAPLMPCRYPNVARVLWAFYAADTLECNGYTSSIH
jgi:hypothetical protein